MKRQLYIRKTAADLRPGMQAKLRHTKRLWTCVAAGSERADGYAVVELDGKKLWLSPGHACAIPIDQDPVLGGGTIA